MKCCSGEEDAVRDGAKGVDAIAHSSCCRHRNIVYNTINVCEVGRGEPRAQSDARHLLALLLTLRKVRF